MRGPYETDSFEFLDQPWSKDALCAQTDPEVFFPMPGTSAASAKRVCLECPVVGDCLAWSLTTDEKFGVWGGLTDSERRKLPHRYMCNVSGCGGSFYSARGMATHRGHVHKTHQPVRSTA